MFTASRDNTRHGVISVNRGITISGYFIDWISMLSIFNHAQLGMSRRQSCPVVAFHGHYAPSETDSTTSSFELTTGGSVHPPTSRRGSSIVSKTPLADIVDRIIHDSPPCTGFAVGMLFALACNLILVICTIGTVAILDRIVDSLLIPSLLVSYFALLCNQDRVLTFPSSLVSSGRPSSAMTLGSPSIGVQNESTASKIPRALCYLCCLCFIETLVNNSLKSTIIFPVSIIYIYVSKMFSNRTNFLLAMAVSLMRSYAVRELRGLDTALRPFVVYFSAFGGIVLSPYLNQYRQLPVDDQPVSESVTMIRRKSSQLPRRYANQRMINNKRRLSSLKHPLASYMNRCLGPRSTHSSFSLTASAVGVPISVPSVSRTRVLDMKLRSFSSFDNLNFDYTNGGTGRPDNRNVHFQGRTDKTSDYETGPDNLSNSDIANITSANDVKCLQSGSRSFSDVQIQKLLPLNRLLSWNFDIFKFADQSGCDCLPMLAYRIFDQVGLLESFNTPVSEFCNYLTAVQKQYRCNPYHNYVHVADVLHTCFFLTTANVPSLSSRLDHQKQRRRRGRQISGGKMSASLSASSSNGSDQTGSCSSEDECSNTGLLFRCCEANNCIGTRLHPIEVFALYLAAVIHDLDHPGRSNSFLIAKKDPLAILYNDRSVLENHHAASAWQLLISDRSFDFLRNLDNDEWQRLRFLTIELVLATDLVKNKQIIESFLARVRLADRSAIGGSRIDWSDPEDRLLVCKMIIKTADVITPSKPLNTYLKWARRIQDEFYLQGDEEEGLNMPVSKFMDRRCPDEMAVQENFTKNITMPILEAFNEAELLPHSASALSELLTITEANTNFLSESRQIDECRLPRVSNFDSNTRP